MTLLSSPLASQGFSLFEYDVAASLPSIERRKGLLLSYQNQVWTEASPLEGLSSETLEEVKKGFYEGKDLSSLPSLAHGVECAFSHQEKEETVKIAALLSGTIAKMELLATDAIQKGLRVAKVKVGHLDFQDAKSFLKELSSSFQLRIDIGKKWDLKNTLKLLESLPSIDYVEEPTSEIKELKNFPFPFALDDSLLTLPFDTLFTLPHLKALVIKPMIFGGWKTICPYYEFAKKEGIQFILSSAWESSIGVYHLGKLANRLSLDLPMGIDTFRYFASDVILTPLEIKEGKLFLPKNIYPNLNLIYSV